MRIDVTFPLTNLGDVLLQFVAGCNLGILIRDMMMKRSGVGEAPYIRPVRSWEEEELMTGALRLGMDLKKSSTLNSVEEISGVGMI